MGTALQVLQMIAAVAIITAILLQTTKSEQSSGSSGMGWGVIGGKSTSSIRTRWGVEEHLNRITMWVAIAFLALSLLASVWSMHGW
ncbi:MAG: preprotein translocase subunit SecG [Armatimonadota bacterium]|nr:MAG: preprotein translocase subunit SecG [Armatimonadota bacterium]